MVATYYAQRAGAGLLITEGTSPSPNGLGYARIPGIYSDEQIAAWRKVADAVHEAGGRIFMQLMHTGRVSHPANLPEGAHHLAPSAVPLQETKMWVDGQGLLDIPEPRAMTADEVESTIAEFVQAAENAVAAGCDGVEIHGANGYLLEQFLNPHTNRRDDEWGGSMENRARFALEVTRRTAEAIGADRVGIRLSPFGTFNEMPAFDGVHETFVYLAAELGKLGLAYMHVINSVEFDIVPDETLDAMRQAFDGTLILAGGYTAERAEQDLQDGKGDLVAFGRPFIANPDLVGRFREGAELAAPDANTFYGPGSNGLEDGYIDYPTLEGAGTV
jgi:N-ethylmaleimide reductase